MSTDVFVYRSVYDIIARFLGVGIFAIENYNHIVNFKSEVSQMVGPALSPLPDFACSIIHACTVCLGLAGSLMFIMSGFKRYIKFASPSLKALLVFMVIISWNWWFRRGGTFLWNVKEESDRRNRLIHCLKNASIFGLLFMMHQMSRVPTKRSK